MNREETRLAIDIGASALGLVSAMPGGPGMRSDTRAAELAAIIPPGVASFLLRSLTSVKEIVRQHCAARSNTIQLVDKLQDSSYRDLREHLPGISLVQVIHVRDERAIEEAIEAAGAVDAILLDSGNPDLAVKELGGTGRVHNWQISRRIRDAVSKPVWLAGGLNPQNVRKAISAVEPFGIDICSGVRTGGRLDEAKLKALFQSLSPFNKNEISPVTEIL